MIDSGSDIQRRQALADFLRTRRARLSPADVGMPAGLRRRTPGLRREEVAQLASMGIGWYTALEQGRDIRPSAAILESLAQALRLAPDERRHLFLLADQLPPAEVSSREEVASPALLRVLDQLDPYPAYILGRRWDRLAWNRAAEALLDIGTTPPPYERNVVWELFLNPAHRRLNPAWEQKAQRVLAEFRAVSERYPGDPQFAALIEDLRRNSPEFRAAWSRHDVGVTEEGYKEMEHPRVGRLYFEHTNLQTPGDSERRLTIYSPLPETDTLTKLELLVSDEPVAVRQT